MKPCLFKTDMARAIPEGRKTVTRRVVKQQHLRVLDSPYHKQHPETPDKVLLERLCEPPYRPGDILYVRETWAAWSRTMGTPPVLYYRADLDNPDGIKWKPSIHMPREAARIFLRATDLKIQRVQDITDEEARKEGCKDRDDFHRVWNNCQSKPQPVKIKGIIDHYESYPWEDIQETRTYRGKPWYVIGNPWVWVIEFKRCEKPEGD